MDERKQVEDAIAALLAQRGTLGDAVVDAAVAALREKLEETPGSASDERKTVTVVMADVQGSTDLAERLSVEAWVSLMDRLFQILQAEIYRYGGEVNQFRGDGLLAFFGAARAHEDDPQRAILASLAMQEAVQAHAADLLPVAGLDLRVRIGVNTGEVIVTQVGDRQRHSEETAMGRAIAVAARMESAAQAGTVLVSEATYALAHPHFEWTPVGPVHAKGIRLPVQAYRPHRFRPVAGTTRGLPGLASPLIGRERELSALQRAVRRLSEGTGGVVTVVGEAGLGKSRLVAELHQWVERQMRESTESLSSDGRRPIRWVEGRCVSYAAGSAYWLWADIVRTILALPAVGAVAQTAGSLDAWIGQTYPECPEHIQAGLCRLVQQQALASSRDRQDIEWNADAETSAGAGEEANHAVPDAVYEFLRDVSQKTPLLIVCEDLHWADASSVALLAQLLPLTQAVPLLFIVVLRPHENPLCEHLLSMTERYRHIDVPLDPLTAEQSAALVRRLLRVESLPSALKARVLELGEGNPFYLEEILRVLMDSGVLVYDAAGQRWQATRSVADIAIPDTLQGILISRIDRLAPEAKHVLQLAAVVGRIFQYGVLEALVPDRTSLEAHLEALQDATLIREQRHIIESGKAPWLSAVQRRTFIFKHHLTQQAAYESLLERERRRVHRAVAEALKDLFTGDLWGGADVLAYHWERTEESSRAIPHLMRAGISAADRSADGEATDYFQRALALARSSGLMLPEADALAHLGDIARHQGNYTAAQEAFEAALAIQQRFGNQRRVAWLLTDLALVARRHGAYAEATTYLERALEISRLVHNPRDEIQGLVNLGLLCRERGMGQEACVHNERALRMARAVSFGPGETAALHGLGAALSAVGDLEGAGIHLETALRRYRGWGERRGEIDVLVERAWLALNLDDVPGATELAQRALAIAEEIHSWPRQCEALLVLGQAFGSQALFNQAEEAYRRALSMRQALGQAHLAAELSAGLAEVALRRGAVDMALARIAAVLEAIERFPSLEGARQPFAVYLTCYDVLRGARDARAADILERAYGVLLGRAERIEDGPARQRFLECIPTHRRVAALAAPRPASGHIGRTSQ